MTAAAGFSLTLEADGAAVRSFGDITVTRAMEGVGTSGLCTSQLTFSTPAPFYGSRAGCVTLSGISGVHKHYIDGRTAKGGIVTVTCLDRMAFADEPFPYASLSFTGDDIPISTVMELIVTAMGELSGYGGIPSWLGVYPREKLEGAACSDILSDIAAACVGVWYISESNSLQFLKYGTYNGVHTVSRHTAPDAGESYSCAEIRYADENGSVHSRGSGGRAYDTLEISSCLITEDGCTEIWERLSGHTHTAVSVESCVMESVPYVGDMIALEGSDIAVRAENISCGITQSGIAASVSANSPAGSEIGTRGKLAAAIDNRVEYNKKTGCMKITKYQAIKLIDGEETVNNG